MSLRITKTEPSGAVTTAAATLYLVSVDPAFSAVTMQGTGDEWYVQPYGVTADGETVGAAGQAFLSADMATGGLLTLTRADCGAGGAWSFGLARVTNNVTIKVKGVRR